MSPSITQQRQGSLADTEGYFPLDLAVYEGKPSTNDTQLASRAIEKLTLFRASVAH